MRRVQLGAGNSGSSFGVTSPAENGGRFSQGGFVPFRALEESSKTIPKNSNVLCERKSPAAHPKAKNEDSEGTITLKNRPGSRLLLCLGTSLAPEGTNYVLCRRLLARVGPRGT